MIWSTNKIKNNKKKKKKSVLFLVIYQKKVFLLNFNEWFTERIIKKTHLIITFLWIILIEVLANDIGRSNINYIYWYKVTEQKQNSMQVC